MDVCIEWFSHEGKNSSSSLGNTNSRSTAHRLQNVVATNWNKIHWVRQQTAQGYEFVVNQNPSCQYFKPMEMEPGDSISSGWSGHSESFSCVLEEKRMLWHGLRSFHSPAIVGQAQQLETISSRADEHQFPVTVGTYSFSWLQTIPASIYISHDLTGDEKSFDGDWDKQVKLVTQLSAFLYTLHR